MTCKSAGVLIKSRGHYLLCKRSFEMKHYSGMWSVPSGHIDKGENAHLAAIRELYEETRISLTKNDLQLIDKQNGFALYYHESPYMYYPVLDIEHIGYCYFDNMEIRRLSTGSIDEQLKNTIINLKL